MYPTIANAQTARLRQDDLLREARARHLTNAARDARVSRGARPGAARPTPLHRPGFLRRTVDLLAGGIHAPSAH